MQLYKLIGGTHVFRNGRVTTGQVVASEIDLKARHTNKWETVSEGTPVLTVTGRGPAAPKPAPAKVKPAPEAPVEAPVAEPKATKATKPTKTKATKVKPAPETPVEEPQDATPAVDPEAPVDITKDYPNALASDLRVISKGGVCAVLDEHGDPIEGLVDLAPDAVDAAVVAYMKG